MKCTLDQGRSKEHYPLWWNIRSDQDNSVHCCCGQDWTMRTIMEPIISQSATQLTEEEPQPASMAKLV